MVHHNERKRLTLGISGFRYEDLHEPEGLRRLHDTFVAELAAGHADLHREYRDYRTSLGEGMAPTAVSDLLVRLAPHVGEFVARLFGVGTVRDRQRASIQRELDTVFKFRTEIVAKLDKHFKGVATSDWDAAAVHSAVELLIRCGFPEAAPDTDAERRVATVAATLIGWSSALAAGVAGDANAAVRVLRSRLDVDPRASGVFAVARACADDREFVEALLETIRRFAHLAQIDAASKAAVAGWVSFKEPEKRDFEALVPHDVEVREGFDVWKGRAEKRRRRDGFALTDKRHGLRH